jgi:hypothetical protein
LADIGEGGGANRIRIGRVPNPGEQLAQRVGVSSPPRASHETEERRLTAPELRERELDRASA